MPSCCHRAARSLRRVGLGLLFLVVAAVARPVAAQEAKAAAAISLGRKLELFVDRRGIERLSGDATLQLHPPRAAEVALRFDRPWEGAAAAYVTVFRDGDKFRMYYRGWPIPSELDQTCLAESADGVVWTRPNLGLFAWEGSKENNVVWQGGRAAHNFTPFKDDRPGVPAAERYKAIGYGPEAKKGLLAFVSADGIRWNPRSDAPILTKGAFDSQNLAFFDPNLQKYVSYYRVFIEKRRAVARVTSDDFDQWTDPVPIDLGDSEAEHFYTNATTPYFRAPHYYFAFPKRFSPKRKKLPEHPQVGISDAVFLSSRDGMKFDRTFGEALIRPGRETINWGDRSTMVAWGLVQTADDEMSIYYSQGYRTPEHHLRRGVFRLDGIASAHASASGGDVLTKPLTFDGKRLVLNYATSAVGSVRVEIQDASGRPIPGFALDDAPELYGDAIAEPYLWQTGPDVSTLAGRTVRLRFALRDADLYSYRFAE